MTTTPATPATTPSAKKPGGYIVLNEQTRAAANTASSMPTGGWEIVGTVQAASAAAAVRKHAEKATPDQSAVLVAVPAKSWKPQRVTAKTTTTLIVEEAK